MLGYRLVVEETQVQNLIIAKFGSWLMRLLLLNIKFKDIRILEDRVTKKENSNPISWLEINLMDQLGLVLTLNY